MSEQDSITGLSDETANALYLFFVIIKLISIF